VEWGLCVAEVFSGGGSAAGVATVARRDPAGARTAACLRALVDVARLVNDGVTRWDRVAEVAVRSAVLVGDAAAMWAQPVGTGTLRCIAASHHDPAGAEPDPFGHDGLIEAVTDSGTPAVLDGREAGGYPDSISAALGPWAGGRSLAGVAIVPMRSKGLSRGFLVAARDAAAAPFGADEIEFLEALAEVTAVTLGTCHVLHGSALAVDEMRQQAELVDHVSDAVVAWDNEGRIITWNAAAENVYGYSAAETIGCDAHALLATRFLEPGAEPRTYAELVPELAATGTWRGELRQRRIDGAEVELLCSLTVLPGPPDARIPSAVALSQDVTRQRGEERRALNDALTGLPNRRFLLRHLKEALARPSDPDGVLSVLFLDLDGFKLVNDTMGHAAGDEVLRVVASRLTEALRRDDVIARLGGDEFVVVCRNVTDRDEAMKVAGRLIASAGRPIPIGDEHARVVPSIGIVVLGGPADPVDPDLSPMDVLRRADAAMYEAKRSRCGAVIAE
jgi:diguanylate cyclase (GGDEF)-like protein/PAS domain S-box-containing protein